MGNLRKMPIRNNENKIQVIAENIRCRRVSEYGYSYDIDDSDGYKY